MANRTIQFKDEEIARRARDLARQITGRVFISRSGLYLVSGFPEFQKLRDCLADLTSPPQDSAVPTPLDLGFQPSQVIPLNHENLSAWGRGLQKWRKIVEDYEQPKAKTSERRQKFQQWKDEVELISHNLERLWDIYRKYEAGVPIDGAPYVRVDITGSGSDTFVPFVEPLWNWLKRLIVWIAGDAAGIRFHRSLLPFMERQSQYEKWRHFVGVLPHLRALRERTGSRPAVEIADAVRKIVGAIPGDIRDEFGFNLPLRPRVFQINRIIADCIRVADNHLLPQPQLIVAAATLCATDGATTPLPEWLFHSPTGKWELRLNAFWELYDQRQKTGYEKLLCALQDMPGVPVYDFNAIRQFLVNGEDIDSILWALRNLCSRASVLAQKGLSPQPFRRLVSVLEKAGLMLDTLADVDNDVFDLVWMACWKKSVDIIETFAMWLESLEPGTLDLNLAKWAWNSLFHLLILVNASPSFKKTVKRWTKPPKTDVLNTFVGDAPPEVYSWLSRLSYYQELCGKEPTLPKTVSKMLSQADRQRQQIEYLRKMRDAGQLNEQAAAKLEVFEANDCAASQKPAMGRLLKHLREVCAHTALEAVRHLIWQESQRIWTRQFGSTPPPTFLSKDEVTAIVAWSRNLEKEAREFFNELVAGWRQHGAGYRQHLSRNSSWVKAASDRINIQAWFCPEASEIDIGGLPIRICVASDPFRIFLMGSYFGTCLSLDKFNCDSVLANAYDANKAVIFALGADGQVMARKLVCVSSDYELIGYRVYISGNVEITSSRREGISQAVDAFAIELARQAGMQPSDVGKPEELSGLFWYNDGTCDLRSNDQVLHPALQEAIQERGQQCVNLLMELGIWPPIDSAGTASCLESMPELAEECLAVLARTVEDPQLARLVFQNALTKGGKVEAMTSLALLEKSDEMAEYVYRFSKKQYDHYNFDLCYRGMEVLRQMGTSKAWHLFMEMGVCRYDDEWACSLWLILAAADSQESAQALSQTLQSTAVWRVQRSGYAHFLLAGEMLAIRGWPLSRAVLARVLTSLISSLEERFEYVQWCPPCPEALKYPNIRKFFEDEFGHDASSSALSVLTAVILAMKSQDARDTAFLKETASRDLSALLALALQGSSKHQEFIRKTASALPPAPASFLALIESEGVEKAEELLASTIKDTSGIAVKWQRTVALRKAFLLLDQGHPVSLFSVKEELGEALPLLPYILFWLWKWTDYEHPNVPALAALAASDNLADFLRNAKVNKLGLVARMAILLRFVDDESAALLRHALYVIMNLSELEDLEEYHILFLGKLSGHKLWVEAPGKNEQKLSPGNVINCPGGWELLMDGEGNSRPVVKWIGYIYYRSAPRLPLDIRLAARALDLLCSIDNVNYDRWEFQPMTEIQRQLHGVTRARASVSSVEEE